MSTRAPKDRYLVDSVVRACKVLGVFRSEVELLRIRDVAQAPDGAIWLLEDGNGANGRLFRITPKG